MVLWLAILAALETEILGDLYHSNDSEASVELLKFVYPDGCTIGEQWISIRSST